MSPASEQTAHVAHIILDSPLPQLDHPFDYSVPERLRALVKVGQRVVVPLRGGQRRSEGWVVGISQSTEFAGNLAEVDSIVSEIVSLTPELYSLARTVADRQAGSVVDVLRLAIPSRYVRAEKEYIASLSSNTTSSAEPVERAPNNSKLVAAHLDHGTRISLLVHGGMRVVGSDLWAPQWVAIFVEHALAVLEQGRSAILTVPDFRDLEMLSSALSLAGLEDVVIRTDASLPGALRWKNFLRLLHEDSVIVIGNRSSVYAPVNNLELIALWDASDESFTEPLAPYAHPRDVALIRQSETGCSLLFAAHVVSVEAARLEKLNYLESSFSGSINSHIVASDLHSQKQEGERSSRIPPAALVCARKAIASGPVLIQVARPGYASMTRCAHCRQKALCSSCHGPLALKTKSGPPACRWCGKLDPAWTCSSCHSSVLAPSLAGSEKTADDLAQAFPGVKVVFSDAEKRLRPIAAEPTLVIATAGTEPLAVGGYRAVVILDGEAARMREDLETDFAALRIWMNAASLAAPDAPVFIAGSGEHLGRVLEQSLFSDFANQALAEREALSLPPATRVAVVTGSRAAIADVEKSLAEMPHRTVLGPVPHNDDAYRLIISFDFKDGATVAKTLRALILKTAITSRKPAGTANTRGRVLRLNVRIDDFALRGLG